MRRYVRRHSCPPSEKLPVKRIPFYLHAMLFARNSETWVQQDDGACCRSTHSCPPSTQLTVLLDGG